MRALLVDDEPLALEYLKKKLEYDIGGVNVVGLCSNPYQVVGVAVKQRPDVVFLDIHMPEMNGLELGEQLQAAVPHTEIVFVTGYDQYAVRAFELYALDYIMKPVRLDRLRLTVQRLRERLQEDPEASGKAKTPLFLCFNQLRVQLPGMEPQTLKWRTNKAQELFAYLLHHRERTVDRGTLIELLWPDFDVSRATQQLYTTIYHIRQTLSKAGLTMIRIIKGELEAGYRLTIGGARVDVEEWEQRLKRLEAIDLTNAEEYEQVLDQFEGNYLGEYEYLWAEYERERIRLLWLQHAENLARFYMDRGKRKAAIDVNLRIQRQLPDREETYLTLMTLYDSLGDASSVEEQYWLLATRMRELELVFPPRILAWYEQWKQQTR
ncbi:response regulator [Paenibacillus sp. FSL M7-1455]|uniref:response regulator n=1 Tax=Paenibacillus sp. FSL M7-1455 TaxID=2975316 RepID=UPI002C5ED900|nr:response regulator [Paenibacillus cookii]